MWIRSQSKLTLVNCNEIFINKESQDKYTICGSHSSISTINGCMELGTYKTDERAMEILDEIQSTIQTLEDDRNFNLTKESCEARRFLYPIYEMPRE